MISDLSAGDRLSLKGKLFELQKKLTIMDLEQRLDNQYPYQPQIKSYDLPNRPRDFIQNNAKAEIIRQQKKKLLQDSIRAQAEESCTFSPKIFTSAEKFAHLDNRPVHVRLTEKAKEYRDSKEQRKKQFTLFDDSGRKLFSPEINRGRTSTSLNSSINSQLSSVAPPVNTATADEFLYQDAKDREIRHANLKLQYQSEAQQAANANKMNATSRNLLKRRTERSISALFTVIDENADDVFDYQDFTEFLAKSRLWTAKDHEEFLSDQQLLWNCFDHYNTGTVLRRQFHILGYCFLMHKTPQSALESFSRHEKHQVEREHQEEGQRMQQQSRFPQMRERELQKFRVLLSMLTEYAMRQLQLSQTAIVPEANTPGSQSQRRQSLFSASQSVDGSNSILSGRRSIFTTETVEPSFKPKIFSHSYKLAQRKERRELEQVSQVVQEQLTKSLEFQMQKEEEQKLEEGRGRNKLQLRANRYASRPLQGHIREPNSVSLSVEQKENGEENKMHISELENDNNFDNGNDLDPVNVELNETTHIENELGTSSTTSRPGESSQAQSSSASRLADKLIARGVLIKKKKEQKAEQVKEQEVAGCTFKPKIKILRSKAKPATGGPDVSASEVVSTMIIDQGSIDNDREIRRKQRREEKRRQKMLARQTEADLGLVTEGMEDSEISGNDAIHQALVKTVPDLPSEGAGAARRGSIATALASLLVSSVNNTVEHNSTPEELRKKNQVNDVTGSVSSEDDGDTTSSIPPPPPPPPPPPSSSSSIIPPPNAPVYERLYALKDKKPAMTAVHLNPKYEQEMEGCTFQPHIERRPVQNQHSTQEILAYDKTVNRMREINATKLRRKEEEENAWKEVDERYKRNRALLLKEGPKPFQFHSEKRLKEIADKARAKAQDKTDLIVEVKLSAVKSARIVVGHNEDPLSAVKKFAKIYGLEADAVQVLLAVVHQAIQARTDAISRAQAEAEEAERRLREEQECLAAEAAAAAALEAEELALRHQKMTEQLGKHHKRRGKIAQHPVLNEHGEEFFLEDDQDEEEGDDDDDDYENDSHRHPEGPTMILTGYDNYGNPIYAPAELHYQQQHQHLHHNHHHLGPHTYSREHHSPHNNNGYHQHGQLHGYAPHGMMTLSDELDMIPVEDEYSSYTGTSSELSDYDNGDEDADDEEFDSDDDQEGSEENDGRKQRTRPRRDSSKRPSILSQFF